MSSSRLVTLYDLSKATQGRPVVILWQRHMIYRTWFLYVSSITLCVYKCECACVCVCVCVHECMSVCAHMWTDKSQAALKPPILNICVCMIVHACVHTSWNHSAKGNKILSFMLSNHQSYTCTYDCVHACVHNVLESFS